MLKKIAMGLFARIVVCCLMLFLAVLSLISPRLAQQYVDQFKEKPGDNDFEPLDPPQQERSRDGSRDVDAAPALPKMDTRGGSNTPPTVH